MLQNEEEAKDVVQETLIKAWNKRNQLHTYQNMEAWCITVARNLSLDKLKSKHKRTVQLDTAHHIASPQPSPYKATEQSDTMQALHKCIANLPEIQKQVLELRDIEGFSYQEISDVLKQNLNTVKVNLFRARKQVRKQLLNQHAYGL